ncbi:MAG: hypothetical protein ACTSPE_07135 [Candidatus Thorarchaeota archaeon]
MEFCPSRGSLESMGTGLHLLLGDTVFCADYATAVSGLAVVGRVEIRYSQGYRT